jgi:hypothetical protein
VTPLSLIPDLGAQTFQTEKRLEMTKMHSIDKDVKDDYHRDKKSAEFFFVQKRFKMIAVWVKPLGPRPV